MCGMHIIMLVGRSRGLAAGRRGPLCASRVLPGECIMARVELGVAWIGASGRTRRSTRPIAIGRGRQARGRLRQGEVVGIGTTSPTELFAYFFSVVFRRVETPCR